MNGCSAPPPLIAQVARRVTVTRREDLTTAPPRPEDPAGAARAELCPRVVRGDAVDQARVASVSFQVADGRMTFAALAGSGW